MATGNGHCHWKEEAKAKQAKAKTEQKKWTSSGISLELAFRHRQKAHLQIELSNKPISNKKLKIEQTLSRACQGIWCLLSKKTKGNGRNFKILSGFKWTFEEFEMAKCTKIEKEERERGKDFEEISRVFQKSFKLRTEMLETALKSLFELWIG